MADTRPITRLTIKDTETGAETETDVKTCARGVTCDEGKTAQDHISDFVAHKKGVNRHVLVQVGGDEPATGPALWLDEDSLLHYKDKSGIKKDLYPATKAALVEGLSELLAGKAAATHQHDAGDIKTGTVPVARGGTGAGDAAAARSNLGAAAADHKHNASDINGGNLPVSHGGTGAATAADARSNLGAAAAEHKHSADDINSGILTVARGGTGAGTEQAARTNLDVAKPVRETVSFPTSGWSLASGAYKQTVNCSVAKATMKYANIGPQFSTDVSARKLEQEAYAQIAYVDTADGKLTATCWGDTQPGVNLTLIFEGGVE